MINRWLNHLLERGCLKSEIAFFMQKRKASAFLIVANFVICCVLTKSKVVFKDYNPKENLLFPPKWLFE